MSATQRLADLGLNLPPAQAPMANYAAAVRVGRLIHVSGQGPVRDGQFVATGKVGSAVTIEEA